MLALRSIEGLIAGCAVLQRYRNRRLGDFLNEIKLTEGRLTGIQMIQTAMHQNGSPDPLFEADEDRTWFSVVLRPHPAFEEADIPEKDLETTNTSQLLIAILRKALNADHHDKHHDEHQDEHQDDTIIQVMVSMLQYCLESPRSKEELFSVVELKPDTRAKRRYIEPLERIGWLEKTLPGRPTSKNQRYRLSDIARNALSQDKRQP